MPDDDLRAIHREFPLLYMDAHALPDPDLVISDGLFLSVDLSGPEDRVVGYRAKRNSHRLELSQTRRYEWHDYWEPVYPEAGGRIVLDPDVFYLLLSAEGVCVPPRYAAEMMAYDPTAGELRTHYAGFFDPGFGYDRSLRKLGSRAAPLLRADRGGRARPRLPLHAKTAASGVDDVRVRSARPRGQVGDAHGAARERS